LIGISVFKKLQEERRKESTEWEILGVLDDLQDQIDRLYQLDNVEKSKLTDGLEKLSRLLDPQD
jgi:hypothetical protein